MIRVPFVVEVGPLVGKESADMLVSILTREYPLSAGAFYRWPLRERACTFFDGDDTPIRPARIAKARYFQERDELVGPGGEDVAEDDEASAIDGEIVPSFRASDPVEVWGVTFADGWPSDPVEIEKRAALIWAIMLLRGFEGVAAYEWMTMEGIAAGPDVKVYVGSGGGAFFDAFGRLARDDALREVLRDGVERLALFDYLAPFDADSLGDMPFDLVELLESDV